MATDPQEVKLPTGGPWAFPWHAAITSPSGTTYATCGGMTLRDYFAGQALIAVLQAPLTPEVAADPSRVAMVCYQIADGMLRASEVK